MGESATQALRLASGAATNGRIEMSKLTDAELLAWARTRTRMLVNKLKAMLVRGEVIPYERT
jgi:hypothetical protein